MARNNAMAWRRLRSPFVAQQPCMGEEGGSVRPPGRPAAAVVRRIFGGYPELGTVAALKEALGQHREVGAGAG